MFFWLLYFKKKQGTNVKHFSEKRLEKFFQPFFYFSMCKSDVKDAHWIARCLQKEMLRGSYVPDEELQQMRDYSRRYFLPE